MQDKLIFAALTLNEIDIKALPATSLCSRFNLLLKELGALSESPSEQEVVVAISKMDEQQLQTLQIAIISLHHEAEEGEVFN